MRKTTALLSAISLTLLSFPAASENAPDPDIDISGRWNFVANTGPECTFNGSAFLTPTNDENRFECKLTAIQTCSTQTWEVEQTCQASKTSNEVVIISSIENYVQGVDNGGYRPDNFKLTIQSPDLMKGVLASWGFHLAEFRRSEGSIS